MKGILLAGGSGTRLYPSTQVISKQLLPVYNKPMVYYPLSVLMLAEIKDILLISTPSDLPLFRKLLGDGKQLGIRLSYQVQDKPRGLAHALIIAEDFLQGSDCLMILGDNIFFGHDLPKVIENSITQNPGVTLFAHRVSDPQRYGVIDWNDEGNILSLEEKPAFPKSCYAATGLYLFDTQASSYAKTLSPSARGELEITDLNNLYIAKDQARVELLGRGYAWLDTGTHSSLLQATQFVEALEKRQGIPVACLEEIAYNNQWIDEATLEKAAKKYQNSDYGDYLKQLSTPSPQLCKSLN